MFYVLCWRDYLYPSEITANLLDEIKDILVLRPLFPQGVISSHSKNYENIIILHYDVRHVSKTT